VPLQRALSKLGVCSRTQARALIAAGLVEVDGVRTQDPEMLVSPEAQRLVVRGVVAQRAERVVLALHKPRGVVTTRVDPQGRATVHDLLQGAPEGVQAVGRLDAASTGLLLLTNDTRLSAWLTNPASGVRRHYIVTVRGMLDEDKLAQAAVGLADGPDVLVIDAFEVLKRSRRETHLAVWLTEGKNREIRRIFRHFGAEVTRLLRVAYGGVVLGALQPGRWREVSTAELEQAFPGAPAARTPTEPNAR
jgi:23S rRNA pseudouridine2605 synthase